MWKLASTERKFPDKFPQGYLLADRVVRQLQYRCAPVSVIYSPVWLLFPIGLALERTPSSDTRCLRFDVRNTLALGQTCLVQQSSSPFCVCATAVVLLATSSNDERCWHSLYRRTSTPGRPPPLTHTRRSRQPSATTTVLHTSDYFFTTAAVSTQQRPLPTSAAPRSYDVDLDRAKKPCLKAVLQGDASAARPMVLCLSRVYTPEEVGTRHGGAAAIVEVCVCVILAPPAPTG